MWKEPLEVAQGLFGLRRDVKQHDEKLMELASEVRQLALALNLLSERVLKMELRQEFHEKQTAANIDNLRLQLENILLRFERRLRSKPLRRAKRVGNRIPRDTLEPLSDLRETTGVSG